MCETGEREREIMGTEDYLPSLSLLYGMQSSPLIRLFLSTFCQSIF